MDEQRIAEYRGQRQGREVVDNAIVVHAQRLVFKGKRVGAVEQELRQDQRRTFAILERIAREECDAGEVHEPCSYDEQTAQEDQS